MKKVLILGATGLVGRYLVEKYKQHRKDYQLYTPSHEAIDLLKLNDATKEWFKAIAPDIIINTVAAHNTGNAEIMDKVFDYNVKAIYNLVEAMNGMDKHYQFVNYSTDYIFGGDAFRGGALNDHCPYYEDGEPDAKNLYGLSKIFGERVIAARCQGEYFNIRIAGVYGSYPSKQKNGNFVLNMLKKYQDGVREIKMSDDVVSNQTYAGDIADYTFKLLRDYVGDADNYNCTNESPRSWYEFALAVKNVFELNDLDILPISNNVNDINRPSYTAMHTNLGSDWLVSGPTAGLEKMRTHMKSL